MGWGVNQAVLFVHTHLPQTVDQGIYKSLPIDFYLH